MEHVRLCLLDMAIAYQFSNFIDVSVVTGDFLVIIIIIIRAGSGRVIWYPNTRTWYPTRPDTRPETIPTQPIPLELLTKYLQTIEIQQNRSLDSFSV